MTTTPFTPGWPPEWPHPPAPAPAPAAPPPPTVLEPRWVPAPSGDDWLSQRLFDQRIVLVRGVVDRASATLLSAALLALDAATQRPITLHIDSPAADLTAALLLADTLDALRVSVHAIVLGEVGGGAVAILAAADRRQAHRHARIRLSEPRGGGPHLGGEITAEQHDALLADFVGRLTDVTGRSAEQVAGDLRAGRDLSAAEAVEYGLLDPVAERTE